MYLVFDIGGTAIKYCYFDTKGKMFDKNEFSSTTLTNLNLFISRLSEIYFKSNYQIDGIALSCPGIINSKKGVIEKITAYPFLKGVNLKNLLSKACNGVKVTIENDAKCAGIAEIYAGNIKGHKDAIVVVLGTGIGGCVIKNRKIHQGNNLFAGEFSTIIVGYDKKSHQILTWSDVASTSALCKRVSNVLEIKEIDGREVFELVKNNNQQVIEILDSFCLDIAIQLYNLQSMYDPEVICIGGGISKQKILIEKIKKALKKVQVQSHQLLMPNVINCKYYNDANLIGALYHHKI